METICITNPPCKDCKKRNVGCHSNCREFLFWKRKERAYRHKIEMEQCAEHYRDDKRIQQEHKLRKGSYAYKRRFGR